MKKIGLLIAALAAFNATASSQAWAESERAMRAACLKASGLKRRGGRGDRSLRR